MHTNFVMLFGLAIVAYALYRRRSRGGGPVARSGLNGGHKLLGVIFLMILPLLILVNPELLALGFLGDAAFVDLLVLLIGLQFQMAAALLRSLIGSALSRITRYLGSPRIAHVGVMFCIAIENVIFEIREIVSRISS
jgi:hypothetical protein